MHASLYTYVLTGSLYKMSFSLCISYCESRKKCLKSTVGHLAIWLFFFSLSFPPPGKSNGLHIFGILNVFPSSAQTGKAIRPQMWLDLHPPWQTKQLTSFPGCIIWRSWIISVSWQCKEMFTGITESLLSIRANLYASIYLQTSPHGRNHVRYSSWRLDTRSSWF